MAEKVTQVPTSACTAKERKKRKTDVEQTLDKKRLDKARGQTRVNIGVAFQWWRNLRELKGPESNTKVANFLLEW